METNGLPSVASFQEERLRWLSVAFLCQRHQCPILVCVGRHSHLLRYVKAMGGLFEKILECLLTLTTGVASDSGVQPLSLAATNRIQYRAVCPPPLDSGGLSHVRTPTLPRRHGAPGRRVSTGCQCSPLFAILLSKAAKIEKITGVYHRFRIFSYQWYMLLVKLHLSQLSVYSVASGRHAIARMPIAR